jgi:transglutaminase-like putative cysteine protease
MRVRVGFELAITSQATTPTVAVLRPHRAARPQLLSEQIIAPPTLPIHEYEDGFGNTVWRWDAPVGTISLRYDALAELSPDPDPTLPHLPGATVDQLPDEVIVYTLPSRYCPSDMVLGEAWQLFGHTADGWPRVQAICDWIHANVAYGYGNSGPSTSGHEAYLARKGVCRDFAHIAIMFCRALNIPARYVYGYLPDIGVPPNPTPMDFHAWFEAYLGGAWRTFDARHNRPRIGRLTIATGRDAVDTAIMTSYGDSRLSGISVWADEVAAPAAGAPAELVERQR